MAAHHDVAAADPGVPSRPSTMRRVGTPQRSDRFVMRYEARSCAAIHAMKSSASPALFSAMNRSAHWRIC